MAVTEVTSPPPERAESTASVLSELKKQSSDVNIIKEYKDMFSKEKSEIRFSNRSNYRRW